MLLWRLESCLKSWERGKGDETRFNSASAVQKEKKNPPPDLILPTSSVTVCQ